MAVQPKKLVIAVLVGLALGSAGLGVYVWKTKTRVPLDVGEGLVETAPTATPSLTLWKDPAGFSTQYPESLKVNPHEEDPDNYAHLELTDPGHPGNIIIWVKDVPRGVKDLASWVKGDKRFAGASILDTTLGGKPAKKIFVSSPSAQLIVGAIADNLLFSVEATLTEKEYWTGIHEAIVGSFAFIPPNTGTGESEPAGAAGAEEAVDEEEVIE